MITITRTIGLGLVLAATSIANAQTTTRVAVSPTSKLWIEGTSNVHDWKCEASGVDSAISIDAHASALPKALQKVVVKLPVKSLKCGHGKMDDNMYKALNADQNPEISFIMATFETVVGEARDEYTLRVSGTLKINGKENPVSMDVTATRLTDGTFKAVATVPVKMTAFDVKPPKAMFGTIKTGDEVKVKFDLNVGPKVVAAADQKE
jgi:polyisoprenoid-binding protein YceI